VRGNEPENYRTDGWFSTFEILEFIMQIISSHQVLKLNELIFMDCTDFFVNEGLIMTIGIEFYGTFQD